MNSYAAFSVGAAAVQLLSGSVHRTRVIVQNVHATQDLYLGWDASVTAANGLKLAAGESVEITKPEALFVIGSGAATTGRYFEES
jgi:hypothetical protein